MHDAGVFQQRCVVWSYESFQTACHVSKLQSFSSVIYGAAPIVMLRITVFFSESAGKASSMTLSSYRLFLSLTQRNVCLENVVRVCSCTVNTQRLWSYLLFCVYGFLLTQLPATSTLLLSHFLVRKRSRTTAEAASQFSLQYTDITEQVSADLARHW